MLTRNSKVPVQLQPLLSFPLHKLDNKQNEEEKHTQQNPPAAMIHQTMKERQGQKNRQENPSRSSKNERPLLKFYTILKVI